MCEKIIELVYKKLRNKIQIVRSAAVSVKENLKYAITI